MELTPDVVKIIEQRRAELDAEREERNQKAIENIRATMREFGLPEIEISTERVEEVRDGGRSVMPVGTPLAGYVCKWCGQTKFALRWNDETLRQMAKEESCFQCNHWLRLIRQPGENMARVVVEGRHYMYDTRMPYVENKTGFLGHGGHVFHIKFLDSGDVMKTNNLWTQGKVPEHFRRALPNNAEFVAIIDEA